MSEGPRNGIRDREVRPICETVTTDLPYGIFEFRYPLKLLSGVRGDPANRVESFSFLPPAAAEAPPRAPERQNIANFALQIA